MLHAVDEPWRIKTIDVAPPKLRELTVGLATAGLRRSGDSWRPAACLPADGGHEALASSVLTADIHNSKDDGRMNASFLLPTGEHHLPSPHMYIGGDRIGSGSAGSMTKFNPNTGEPLAEFPLGGVHEVDLAVAAARAAFPAWRATAPAQRRMVLLRIAELLEQHADEFDLLAAIEIGIPLGSVRVAARPVEYFRYYAGWTDKLGGANSVSRSQHGLEYVSDEPYGVIAAILVWNGPLMTAAMKCAPAAAAGNTVVLKAPELAPFAVMRFAELCAQAGLPAGVINVVTGGPDAGQALVAHPGVDKVSFTGSIAVARQVLKTAADHITPVVMELGGKSANIIFEDANLKASAVLSALYCKNAGQGCNLPTRLLVQESIYDEFMELAVATVSRIVVGDALQSGVEMGPVVSAAARDRIMGVIDGARSQGSAKLLAGGNRLDGELAGGYFIAPTIFGDVDNRSTLAQEEIFGPVVAAMRFRDEREAIEMANDSAYGLAAYLSTRDVGRAHRVADQLVAGYVAVNGANPMPASSPYGGFKGSGYGKEGGRQGIEEFLRPKTVYIAIE